MSRGVQIVRNLGRFGGRKLQILDEMDDFFYFWKTALF